MLLEIDTFSTIPIYQQLHDQIILGIAKNELAVGESLPTVRQLADELGVNTMTISKAYTLLKDEGYLATDRRKGSIVLASDPLSSQETENLHYRFSLLLAEARLHQVSLAKVNQITAEIWQSFSQENKADK